METPPGEVSGRRHGVVPRERRSSFLASPASPSRVRYSLHPRYARACWGPLHTLAGPPRRRRGRPVGGRDRLRDPGPDPRRGARRRDAVGPRPHAGRPRPRRRLDRRPAGRPGRGGDDLGGAGRGLPRPDRAPRRGRAVAQHGAPPVRRCARRRRGLGRRACRR
ncbi:hypothetical protein NOCARDAX2BIS_220114 [Nocardioides sp. AX2bis]|nr:hypothetical protein NOCARDAX2BIS_220114 [Nocardioides sp. AX2bis]